MTVLAKTGDLFKAAVAASGLMTGTKAMAAGISDPDLTLIQMALREGGAFAIILVILFFYRRDWKTTVEFWKDQHATTTTLVQDSTRAQVASEAALRENTMVTHSLKQLIADRVPDRRL